MEQRWLSLRVSDEGMDGAVDRRPRQTEGKRLEV